MLEEILTVVSIVGVIAMGGSIWYKMGKLEEKIDFIYEHINVCFSFKGCK